MTHSLRAHRWPVVLIALLLSSFEIFGEVKLNGVLCTVSFLMFFVSAVSLMGLVWREGRAVPVLKFLRWVVVPAVAILVLFGSLTSAFGRLDTVLHAVDCGSHRQCLVIGRGAFGGTWQDVVQRRFYLWIFHVDERLLQLDRESVLQMQHRADDLVLLVQEYGKPAREVTHRLNAQ